MSCFLFRVRRALLGSALGAVLLSGAPAVAAEPWSAVRPGSKTAGPAFLTLTAGQSTRRQAEGVLGRPTGRTPAGHQWARTEHCRRYGLTFIRARYRRDGVLDRMDLGLRTPPPLDAILTRLRLRKPEQSRRDELFTYHEFPPMGLVLMESNDKIFIVRLSGEHVTAPPGKPPKPPAPPKPAPDDAALLAAAARGDKAKVKALLDRGAKVSVRDGDGRTPLHLAARGSHFAAASLLVASGADVDAADKARTTALHLAAMAGDDAVVALLLAGGAYPRARDADGDTPADLTRSRPITRRLKKAAGDLASNPDHQKARRVVEAFLDAFRRGDAGQMKKWTTPKAAAMVPQKLAPLKMEYKIRQIEARGARGRAVVWLKCLDATKTENQFLLTAELRRAGRDWRIAGTDMKHHFPSLDRRQR